MVKYECTENLFILLILIIFCYHWETFRKHIFPRGTFRTNFWSLTILKQNLGL